MEMLLWPTSTPFYLTQTRPEIKLLKCKGIFNYFFSLLSLLHSCTSFFFFFASGKAARFAEFSRPRTLSGHLIPIRYFSLLSCSSLSGPPAFIPPSALPTNSLTAELSPPLSHFLARVLILSISITICSFVNRSTLLCFQVFAHTQIFSQLGILWPILNFDTATYDTIGAVKHCGTTITAVKKQTVSIMIKQGFRGSFTSLQTAFVLLQGSEYLLTYGSIWLQCEVSALLWRSSHTFTNDSLALECIQYVSPRVQ